MGLALQMVAQTAQLDDATLIDQVQTGDEAAFSQLYKRYARHIAGVVYRLIGDDAHLEDIVQETFVIGLRQLDRLREPACDCSLSAVKRHIAAANQRLRRSGHVR